MEKIRTTFMPDQELEVDDTEAASLRQMGVVLDDTQATTETGLRKAAEKQLAAKNPSTDDQPEG